MLREGGVDAFLRRDILSYVPGTWYVPSSVKVGYEISCTPSIYKSTPLCPLVEIRRDILELEQETRGCWERFWGAERPKEARNERREAAWRI